MGKDSQSLVPPSKHPMMVAHLAFSVSRANKQTPLEGQLQRTLVVQLQLAWILTGIGAIHHLQHAELQGLNALLNTTFAKEWN